MPRPLNRMFGPLLAHIGSVTVGPPGGRGMWRPWGAATEPWRETPGWEFDLLRALPPEAARQVFQRASRRAYLEMTRTWQWWALVGLALALTVPSLILVWVVAANLGLGQFGAFVLEMAFHGTVGALILHPLVRLQHRWALPYVRAPLADELLDYARDGLAPPRREPLAMGRRATRGNARSRDGAAGDPAEPRAAPAAGR